MSEETCPPPSPQQMNPGQQTFPQSSVYQEPGRLTVKSLLTWSLSTNSRTVCEWVGSASEPGDMVPRKRKGVQCLTGLVQLRACHIVWGTARRGKALLRVPGVRQGEQSLIWKVLSHPVRKGPLSCEGFYNTTLA